MKVSISEAARRYVVSRNTVYEDGKNGNLTVHTDEKGKKTVDVADLHRLYKPRQQETSSVDPGEQLKTPENDNNSIILQAKVDLLEQRIEDKSQQIEKLDAETVWLRSLIDKQTDHVKLITDERDKKSREAEEKANQLEEKERQLAAKDRKIEEASKPLTFWERLTGRRQQISAN